MSDRRQALYDRIRTSSKDEVVLEEMIRLGFWPARGTVPLDPGDEIRERGEIERELAALRTEQSRLHNIEALKKELMKRRLAASRAKQAETKVRRERERVARAEAWKVAKTKDIVFLGRGVSGGLSDHTCDETKLARQGLPLFRTAEEIARAAGLSIPDLRFLSYARNTSKISHYRRFNIPKKTGGVRTISAPMPRLKSLQGWLLENVLEKVPVHEAAHGFRAGRSIVSNATPHVGARVVVNMDLLDFFPSIALPRIKGMFRSLGYGDFVASVFALVASEPDTFAVELDGRTFHVAHGPRKLPQGAPTSPAVTNVLCRRLDRRLHGAAKKLGFVYSRYADDLTFSTKDEAASKRTGQMLAQARFIVLAEGFTPHPKKTRVLRRGSQQDVTGVIVNQKASIERERLRAFRALLHAIETKGPEGRSWGTSPDVFASAKGFASYVAMVDPPKGRALLGKVAALAAKYGYRPPPRGGGGGGKGPKKPVPPGPSAAGPSTANPASASTPAPVQAPPQVTPPQVTPPAPAAPVEPPAPGAPEKKKWWKLF